jgi:hypothetical protein
MTSCWLRFTQPPRAASNTASWLAFLLGRVLAHDCVASYDTLLTDAFADQTGMGLL